MKAHLFCIDTDNPAYSEKIKDIVVNNVFSIDYKFAKYVQVGDVFIFDNDERTPCHMPPYLTNKQDWNLLCELGKIYITRRAFDELNHLCLSYKVILTSLHEFNNSISLNAQICY